MTLKSTSLITKLVSIFSKIRNVLFFNIENEPRGHFNKAAYNTTPASPIFFTIMIYSYIFT